MIASLVQFVLGYVLLAAAVGAVVCLIPLLLWN